MMRVKENLRHNLDGGRSSLLTQKALLVSDEMWAQGSAKSIRQ